MIQRLLIMNAKPIKPPCSK